MQLALAGLAAVVVLLLPGGLTAAALRVRGLWWLAAAPVLSVSVIGIAGVVGAFVGIPFSPLLVAGVTAVVAVAALALRPLRLRPLGRWDRDVAWVASAVAVSGVAIGAIALGGLDPARTLSQTYDGVFHLNAVAYLLETGNASSFDLYKMTQEGDANEFYPAAWHSLVALTVQLSGAPIAAATNVVWVATSALLWVTGVSVLTATALSGRVAPRTAGIIGALLASCSATFPYLLLVWGTLYPTGLAYAVLPFGLAVAVLIVQRTDAVVAVPVALGVLWSLATVFAHPRSIPSFVAVAAPVLLLSGIGVARRLWRRPGYRRRVMLVIAAIVIGTAAVLGAVWVYVYRTFDVANRPIADHLNGGPATARQGVVEALLQVVAQAPLLPPAEQMSFPSIALAAAALVGLVLAVRRSGLRWLVAAFALVAVLYALAAGSNSDIAKLATGVWYKDKYRLLALLAVVAVPLATLAIAWLGEAMARRRERVGRLTVIATTTVVVLTSWAVLVFGGTRAAVAEVFVVQPSKDGALLDDAELDLLDRIAETVPEGEVIAGDPWDGSALTWAVGERRAMFPHFVGDWTPDELVVATRLDQALTDTEVCAAVNRLQLRWVFADDEYLWGTPPPEAALYDGLRRAPAAGVLEVVESDGTSTLYRIAACRGSGPRHYDGRGRGSPAVHPPGASRLSVSSSPIPSGFVEPGRGVGLLDVFRRRYLLSLLVRKEVQVRYRGSVLGWLWSYVKPTAQFIVFYLALGVFLRLNESLPGYPIYLFSGLIVINLFNEAFGNGTKSLVDNGSLIKKIYLPREMFPVASTIVAFVNFLPQMLVTLVVCLFVGWAPQPLQVLGILLGMLIIVVLATGLGMLFGAANVSFRDSQNFVELIALVVTWVSPILYSWTTVRDVVPGWLLTVYLLNPVTAAVELFHAGFWFPTTDGSQPLPPNLFLNGLIGLAIALVVLAIGQAVFRKLEGRFAQDL